MEETNRISLPPRTSVSLWLGAVPPVAAGFATGGLAAALGCAFVAACPLLAVLSARWPVRAPRFFPLYFVALFLVALGAFEFNSPAFVVDTWAALLLGLLTIPAGQPEKINSGAITGAPSARRRETADAWTTPKLVPIGPRSDKE